MLKRMPWLFVGRWVVWTETRKEGELKLKVGVGQQTAAV
jgi:hypothetical protein